MYDCMTPIDWEKPQIGDLGNRKRYIPSQTSSHQTLLSVQVPLQCTPSAWLGPMITLLNVAPDSRINIASASPVSSCSAQTFVLRSYFIILPSNEPETGIAVATVVDPADAGNVVVKAVGVCALIAAAAANNANKEVVKEGIFVELIAMSFSKWSGCVNSSRLRFSGWCSDANGETNYIYRKQSHILQKVTARLSVYLYRQGEAFMQFFNLYCNCTVSCSCLRISRHHSPLQLACYLKRTFA